MKELKLILGIAILLSSFCLITSYSCSKDRLNPSKEMLCCCKDSMQEVSNLVLDEGFSETEFKEAIIGKWESVYEIEGKDNVMCLGLTKELTACIVLKKENIEKEFAGNYTINFLRPPQEGFVTLGKISIITSKDSIILSRIIFSLHNGVSVDKVFLRIFDEPYGTLDRIK